MGNTAKTKNMTVCYWTGQAALIKKAAHAKHLSVADWHRSRVVALAAEDAGVPLPHFQPFAHRGRASTEVIAQAARVLGIPVDRFVQRTAEKAALVVLEELTRPSTLPPPPEDLLDLIPTFGKQH